MTPGWGRGGVVAALLLATPVVAVEGEPLAPSPPPGSAVVETAKDPLAAAREAARLGRTREAMRALAAVARQQPGTEEAGEAFLGLADHHRAAGDLTRARAALEAARCSGQARARSEARLVELDEELRAEVARLRAAAAARPRYAGAGAPAAPRLRSRSSL